MPRERLRLPMSTTTFRRLDVKVVGYACTVGAASIGAFSHGYARTSANAPAKLFLPSTKITVASVSKVVTALAAIRVLAKNNVDLNSDIEGASAERLETRPVCRLDNVPGATVASE